METKKQVALPVSVVGPVDVGRLLRELAGIEEQLQQAALRKQAARLPKTSQLLVDTLELNWVDLLQVAERQQLQQFLQTVRQQAPRLHVSLGSDPSPEFSAKLVQWLRQQIHPLVLLTFGLQPNIGAGCIVRTTNKYFDFSLGKDLLGRRAMLVDLLHSATAKARADDPAAIEAAALATAAASLDEVSP